MRNLRRDLFSNFRRVKLFVAVAVGAVSTDFEKEGLFLIVRLRCLNCCGTRPITSAVWVDAFNSCSCRKFWTETVSKDWHSHISLLGWYKTLTGKDVFVDIFEDPFWYFVGFVPNDLAHVCHDSPRSSIDALRVACAVFSGLTMLKSHLGK